MSAGSARTRSGITAPEAGTGTGPRGGDPALSWSGAGIERFDLPDGRRAEYFAGGDPTGRVLVMHHGTPSDATTFAAWSDACASRRFRLVCLSRPGYGGSDRRRGRSVADAAADTAALLDRLGTDAFHTVGWSGGGPHALACGALLGARCRGIAVLAGVGPREMAGVDFLAGMAPENVAEFGAAFDGENVLRGWLERNAVSIRTVTGPALADAFGGLVPPVDRAILRGTYADELAAVMRRALAPGFDGWIDDDLAFVRPWGFAPEEISVPVACWQGELDLMVPAAHGRWLADRVPGARFRFAPGHGHVSLVVEHRGAILDELLAPPSA